MVNKIFSARSFCFVSLIVVLLFIFSNRASAVSANDSLNNVYQCGTLDSAGTYTMNQSIIPSGSIASCINITNQNITLNCAGFWISNITLAKTGIYSNQINTTVKNCNVTMKPTSGGQAVTLTGANNSYVFNSTFSGYQVIVLTGANNNILEKLTINGIVDSSHDGIIFTNSNNNQLLNITSTGNNYGISLSGSNNTLKYNNLTGNTYNFQFGATSNSNIDNSIDTSNLVGGYYIYYNYSISNYEYNSNSAPNAGLVYCLNCTNITIKDLNLSYANEKGIYFFNTTNSTIQNVTSNSNRFGIVFDTSSNNRLVNVTSSNNRRGIDFKTGSNNNVFQQVTVQSNYDYGIYLETDSGNNTLSSITTNQNDYGLYLSSSSNNNLSNINSNDTNSGIYLSASNDNQLFNMNLSNGKYGIYLTNSKNNTLTQAVATNNFYGVYLQTNSHNNNLSSITSNRNGYGFFFLNSQNITLTQITANENMKAVNSSGSSFNSNSSSLSHNLLSNIINSSLIDESADRTYAQNSNISLVFYISYLNGTATSNYLYNVSVYPSAPYLALNNSNNLTITFNTTKEGIYTISVNVTLSDTNDTEIRNFVFLLGNTSSKTATFYMHSDKPAHGQNRNSATSVDSGSAYSYSTTAEETLNALSFIQYSPEQVINQYFLIKNISLGWFYKGTGTPLSKIQRYASFSTTADYSQSIPASSSYVFNTTNFTDLNITSDYAWRFYWIALKLSASSPYALSNLTQQSYADFTYLYSGPQITYFGENAGSDIRNMKLLSSTFDNSANKNSTIQLDGEGNVTIVLNLTSTNYAVKYDGILCPSQNCTVNSNSGGIINVTLSLGSTHTLTLAEETIPPSITINSPANQTYTTSLIIFNLTVTDYTEVDRCFYSLEGIVSNATMSNISSEWSGSTSFGDGSFTVDFYCNDSLGNVNNTERMTFSISLPSTTVVQSSGGGLPSYKPAEVNLENGYEKDLREGFKINFRAGDGKTENHTLTVKDISKDSVTVTVSSEPVTFTLKVNETKKLDLDKNGIYDLEIYLKEIKGYFANVGLKKINEKIIDEENVSEETGEVIDEDGAVVAEEDKEETNLFLIFGSAVVIIILVICLILVLRHRNRKRRLRGLG